MISTESVSTRRPLGAIMHRIVFAAMILCGYSFCALADEPGRFALLIGNANYSREIGTLTNPTKDIDLINSALLKIGFDKTNIMIVPNATGPEIREKVDDFARRVGNAEPGSISFVYYSGHGAANEHRDDYLIPVDVPAISTDNFWFYSVSLPDLIDQLSNVAPLAKHFVIFDACREELKLRNSNKSLVQAKGFSPVPNPHGEMLVAFANREGLLTKDDGEYAKVLADEILKPGIDAVTMFNNVQLRIGQDTGREPWIQKGGIRPVFFAGEIVNPTDQPNNEDSSKQQTLKIPHFSELDYLVASESDDWDSRMFLLLVKNLANPAKAALAQSQLAYFLNGRDDSLASELVGIATQAHKGLTFKKHAFGALSMVSDGWFIADIKDKHILDREKEQSNDQTYREIIEGATSKIAGYMYYEVESHGNVTSRSELRPQEIKSSTAPWDLKYGAKLVVIPKVAPLMIVSGCCTPKPEPSSESDVLGLLSEGSCVVFLPSFERPYIDHDEHRTTFGRWLRVAKASCSQQQAVK
jgi:hypothetical protein